MAVHVIGLGVGGASVDGEKASTPSAELSPAAQHALRNAQVVIGSERQLASVAPCLDDRELTQLQLPKLSELEQQLAGLVQEYSKVVILASGDPLYFGIGKWLKQRCEARAIELRTYPAVSSIQAACHRLQWSLQDCEVVSVHGRPLENLRTCLNRSRQIVCLTDGQSQPQHIATLLTDALAERQAAKVQVTVCERLGYPDERIRAFSLEVLNQADLSLVFDPLHVTCIALPEEVRDGERRFQFPGIPDTAYVTDKGQGRGMLTKRDVRLSILSRMSPSEGDVIWDIGAGCGGVSVELAYWQTRIDVYAIELHPERLACLSENRIKFGLEDRLRIIEGQAPEACASLPQPTKIFIGGSGGQLDAILSQAWAVLPPGGLLVASAVTESTRMCYANYHPEGGVLLDQTEISTRTAEQVGSEVVLKPALPVQVFCWQKEAAV